MWYNTRYENTHFYPTFHPGRTAPNPSGTAFVRCLCDASLPDLESIGARGTSPGDCSAAGLRRPNRAQRDPRVQCHRPGGAARRVLAPHRLHTSFSEDGLVRLKDLLHRSPRDFGKERGLWTLELAAQVSFEQGIIATPISDESV